MSQAVVPSVRGMRHILPPESLVFLHVREVLTAALRHFGYSPWEVPVIERTALYQRSIGDETDIVSKEMYTFTDRSGESITLRPEGTAGVVRTVIQKGLLQTPQKLYIEGPMFRYERPQKDRYRQFTQISVESFGYPDPAQDAELIQLSASAFEALGVIDFLTLEINTIGTPEERQAYRHALVEYLSAHRDALDEDSQRRLETNPLRILDSKIPQTRAILDHAPRLSEHFGEVTRAHDRKVCQLLDDLGITYQRNPYLVRGLDYYCHTVFEWTTDRLGAQGTVCAGGRYDGLVAQLGGKDTPAAGFAFGLDRIVSLVEACAPFTPKPALLYAAALDEAHNGAVMNLCAAVRKAFPAETVRFHGEAVSLKTLLKKADASGAIFAAVIGETEAEQGKIWLKNLRTGAQWEVALPALITVLQGVLPGGEADVD